ncbi:hypothetical protein HPB51_016387 [Rhipicephalus microplus]|uniref:Uncharacterized protein n=1 Tax=Rhipicephalus microplus TaxID=6941 RepID=A0A9J6DID1_RHIMP|nr:hypothetical protein HPB51_016387 [Rhipicephalus microplus]
MCPEQYLDWTLDQRASASAIRLSEDSMRVTTGLMVTSGGLMKPFGGQASQTILMSFPSPGQGHSPWLVLLPVKDWPLDTLLRSGDNYVPVALVPTNGGSIPMKNPKVIQMKLQKASSLFQKITEVRQFGRGGILCCSADQDCIRELLNCSELAAQPGWSPPSRWSPPKEIWHQRLPHVSESTFIGTPDDESYVANSNSSSILYPTSRKLSNEPSQVYYDAGATSHRHVRPLAPGDAVRENLLASRGPSRPPQRLHRPRAQSAEPDHRQSDASQRAAQRHTTRRLYQDSDDDVTRSGTPSPMTPAIFTDCKYMSNARAPTRLQQRVAKTARQRIECASSCYRRTGRRQSHPLPR